MLRILIDGTGAKYNNLTSLKIALMELLNPVVNYTVNLIPKLLIIT